MPIFPNLGQLPHLYLRIIDFLQEQLQVNKEAYADSSSQQDRFIEKQHLTPELKGTGENIFRHSRVKKDC